MLFRSIGAFERAMLVYQQSSRLLFFNHAHNEYLQLLAEGGLLVAVPVGCAVLVGIRAAWHRLSSDDTPIFWLRAGALGGMTAVAVQNVWDTGLRMPANAALFAIVAAMALHADRRTVPAVGRPGRSCTASITPEDPDRRPGALQQAYPDRMDAAARARRPC